MTTTSQRENLQRQTSDTGATAPYAHPASDKDWLSDMPSPPIRAQADGRAGDRASSGGHERSRLLGGENAALPTRMILLTEPRKP